MFSLLSGFWHYLFDKPNIHVLIIGLDYAGKTTVLEKTKAIYKGNGLPPEKIPPTIGMNLLKITHKGSAVVIWDLGGQMKMRGIWEKYYDESNAVVFVVDSADIERLDEAKAAFGAICDHETLRNVPIIVLANKQDLTSAMTLQDFKSAFATRDLSIADKIKGVSAITGEGIQEAIDYIVDEARRHRVVR